MCLGSKLQDMDIDYLELEDIIISGPVPVYELVAPHNKMDRIKTEATLRVPLPYCAGMATYLYLKYAYPELKNILGATHNKLFVATTTGKPLQDSQALNRAWRRIQAEQGVTWVPFP